MKRPLSPHLTIYKMENNMLFSIFHRGTGIVLAFFVLFGLNIYYVSYFTLSLLILNLNYIIFNVFLKVVYFLCTFSVLYHLLHGINHIIWDTAKNLDLNTISFIGKLTFLSSFILSLIDVIIL